MKKILLGIGILLGIFNAQADLTGSGFYRVKNYGSSRWCSLVDDKGDLDLVAGKADLHALSLTLNPDSILSVPGSIVYISKISGTQYDIAAQGTSLGALVNHPINIGEIEAKGSNGQSLYQIWGTYSNITKYISDGNISTIDNKGIPTTADPLNPNYKRWEIIPVSVTGDNYFGAVPSLKQDGNLYTTLFTSFAYEPYSEGVKAYYVGRVGFGMVEMIEINGAVPPASPVIIQCAGESVSQNRLKLTESQDALPTNSLTGVYFDYKYNNVANQVAYNPDTMRVLGICKDGSLGFVTSTTLSTIPANTAYLSVPAGSSPEFKCVSTAEFEANIPQAPDFLYFTSSQILQPQDDYNYTGTLSIEDANGDATIRFYTSSTLSDRDAIGPYEGLGKNQNIAVSKEVSMPFSYGSPYAWTLTKWEGGNVDVTVNIQYQYVKFYAQSAGVESVTADSNFNYNGNIITTTYSGGIQLLNMSGQSVRTSNGYTMDISDLPKGVYIAISNGKSLKIVR